jgi:hypothetical protein
MRPREADCGVCFVVFWAPTFDGAWGRGRPGEVGYVPAGERVLGGLPLGVLPGSGGVDEEFRREGVGYTGNGNRGVRADRNVGCRGGQGESLVLGREWAEWYM